jgi:hypothetical protein
MRLPSAFSAHWSIATVIAWTLKQWPSPPSIYLTGGADWA